MKYKSLIRRGIILVSAALMFPAGVYASENPLAEEEAQVQTEVVTEAPAQTEPETPAQPEIVPDQTAPPQVETQPQTENSQTGTDAQTEVQQTDPVTQQGQEDTSEAVTDGALETDNTKNTARKEKASDKKARENNGEVDTSSQGYYVPPQLTGTDQSVMPSAGFAEDFRFTRVEDAQPVIIKKGAMMKERKSIASRTVAVADEKAIGYILADADKVWIYIESGDTRGFVNKNTVIMGDAAGKIIERDGENCFHPLTLILPSSENKAIDYTKTTTQDLVVEKDYALAKRNVNVYESRDYRNARIVGTMDADDMCYILEDKGEKMVYIESGDVRGFILKDALLTGVIVSRQVERQGENAFQYAEPIVTPQDNAACYYTMTSVWNADMGMQKRKEVVEFALQFVGNPYVWGGTSLTDGADCSGFVQSVYAHFGYYIPRVAENQAYCGTQIPLSEALPGDLIFYCRDGYIYHVSMYIGDGEVVQAYSTQMGIIRSGVGPDAVWAVRVVS